MKIQSKNKKRIVFILTRKFWPTNSGHDVVLYNYCKCLHELFNYEIYVYYFSNNKLENDKPEFIKEVKNLEDIENIKNIKSISNANIVCLIDSGLFMFELLEFNPLAFIRSANINADLDELINRIEYLNKGLGVMLEFQCGYQTVRMNVKNITYVESYAHYLLIHTLNSTVKVREKISVALQKLEPLGFIQVHRSYVINHDRIKKIDTDNITLSDETIIPIGKKYKQALKNH